LTTPNQEGIPYAASFPYCLFPFIANIDELVNALNMNEIYDAGCKAMNNQYKWEKAIWK
jgi:hypothetical protein